MDINNKLHFIEKILKGKKDLNEREINVLLSILDDCTFKYKQKPEDLIKQVIESEFSRFKLIASINDDNSIMEWCNDASGFSSLLPKLSELVDYKGGDYLKRTYTREEMPDVINNALDWLDRWQNDPQNKYLHSYLHVVGID